MPHSVTSPTTRLPLSNCSHNCAAKKRIQRAKALLRQCRITIGFGPKTLYARVVPENNWVMYPGPPEKQACRDRVFRYRFHLSPLARRSKITLEFMVQARFCRSNCNCDQ